MKVLITGANGLLGQKLVPILLSAPGYQVLATSRNPGKFQGKNKNFQFHNLDITDQDAISKLADFFIPDVIINTAAITQVDDCELNPDECHRVNVDGPGYLAEFAKQYGAFLIHLSSDFVFDGREGPYRETDIPNPISYYGECKLESERIIQSILSEYAIVRTVLVYGYLPNRSRSNIVLWVKESLEDGKEIRVVTDQYRTPTLAEDLAAGCKLIIDKQAAGIFHISGTDWMSPFEMAIRTARFFELNESLIKEADSSNFTQPAKRPPKTGFIIDKARNQLRYEPHTFEDGLKLIGEQMLHSQ